MSSELLLVAKCHWAEYRQKPLLNIGFIVSLAIATSTLLSILVLNHASKQAYYKAAKGLVPAVVLSIVSNSEKNISTNDYRQLKKLGFHQLTPIHEFEKRLKNNKTITFRAVDILPLALTNPKSFNSQQINLSSQYANRLGLSLSGAQSITLKDGTVLTTKINQRNDIGDIALIDLPLAWQNFPEITGFNKLIASEMSTAQIARLEHYLPDHLSLIRTWSVEQRAGFADALHVNLTALGVLAFVVSLFIAFQAANQAWSKRAELASQLKLFGVNLSTLKAVMLWEALLLAILSTLMGTVIAILLVNLLLPLLGLTLTQLYQLQMSGDFQWRWQYTSWAFGIASAAVLIALAKQFALLSSAYPIPTGTNITNKALTGTASTARAIKAKFIEHWLLSVALLFILASYFCPEQTWLQLKLKYGLLLLASVAILPSLLNGLLRLMTLLTESFRWQFVVKDAIKQIDRRFLPLAAFYLALTTSIAAALMINSFESSFINYLNRLLNSDVFISYSTEQKTHIYHWLSEQPEIEEIVFFRKTQAKIADDNLDLYSITSARQQAALLLKSKTVDPLNTNENSCYINEPLAYKRNIALNQQLSIRQTAAQFNCRVIGIYYDYGNQHFAVKVANQAAINDFTAWQESGFGVFFKEHQSISTEVFIDQLALDSSQVYQPAQVKALALKVFKQTFVLTQAIALVLLTIACFGLFMSAHALELARKADLHLLFTIGYQPVEIFIHMLYQWLLLVTGCILLSWPIAVVLANALVNKILPASFGWSMPLFINITPFAVSSIIGLLVLLPALAIPLYRINSKASLS